MLNDGLAIIGHVFQISGKFHSISSLNNIDGTISEKTSGVKQLAVVARHNYLLQLPSNLIKEQFEDASYAR